MATTRQQSGKGGRQPARKPATSRPTSGPSSRSRAASTKNGRSTPAAAPQPAESRSTGAKLVKPVLAGGAAVAAIVGGAVIGARAQSRKRRFPASLGNPLKQLQGVDLNKARKQVGRAGKQFGELTRELRKAGEQAERIGDALL